MRQKKEANHGSLQKKSDSEGERTVTRWILCALVLLFACGPICAGSSAQQPNRKPLVGGGPAILPKGYLVQEIRDGLYWVSDGAYNTMFLVTSDGVIAIDAPPTLGPNYLKAIAEVTSQPITYLVYSHEHTDHIGAAYLFPKGVKIVAQKETAEILALRRDPRRPAPTITFTDTYTLKLGGQTLVLDDPGINHERGNIFIYAPKQKTLMLVDVVYPGYMPYKNMGIAEDIPGYMEVQKKALAYDFSTFVGGHVTRLGDRSDVELSTEFTSDLYMTGVSALNSLSLPDFAKTNAARAKDKWDLHNEYEKAVVDLCYNELLPRWQDRLADSPTYLRDNCWAMMESIIVTLPPENSLNVRPQ
jgi:glyoxylase-like metal-dependent hydrolase (beta-lactamase superfamily II)